LLRHLDEETADTQQAKAREKWQTSEETFGDEEYSFSTFPPYFL